MHLTAEDHESTASTPAFGGAEDERLQRVLEGLSLTGSEARTLVVLLRLGSAGMKQLSLVSGISRPNLYPVLDSLHGRRVAHRLGGRFAIWTTPGPDEVLSVLEGAEADRLAAEREAFQRAEESRAAVAAESSQRLLDEAKTALAQLRISPVATTAVIAVDDEARSGAAYLEALATVEGELLVFNRGPFPGDEIPAPEVLDCLARGVRARAMYQRSELDDPGLRSLADVYARAGVDQRTVDVLPVSMAVVGGRLVLLSLPHDDTDADAVGFHTATVRNRGMVELVSAAFEHLWSQGRPYVRTI